MVPSVFRDYGHGSVDSANAAKVGRLYKLDPLTKMHEGDKIIIRLWDDNGLSQDIVQPAGGFLILEKWDAGSSPGYLNRWLLNKVLAGGAVGWIDLWVSIKGWDGYFADGRCLCKYKEIGLPI